MLLVIAVVVQTSVHWEEPIGTETIKHDQGILQSIYLEMGMKVVSTAHAQ